MTAAAPFLWIVLGYLLGSIPFGILTAKVFGLGDLRRIGSGNIGATNVLRTGNKAAAALTLVMDGSKGAAAVLLARSLAGPDVAQIAGLAAFMGHCYPVWLGFKGGKGVATFLGVWLALAPPIGLAACASWIAVAVLTRISSAGAMAAAALSPVWVLVFGRTETLTLSVVLAIMVILRHRENIARLRTGSEPRIGGDR
ncbi:MAG: glycerol-3-phosphate 1-O-acyltransferase PlsY [Marinibacterium sp.]